MKNGMRNSAEVQLRTGSARPQEAADRDQRHQLPRQRPDAHRPAVHDAGLQQGPVEQEHSDTGRAQPPRSAALCFYGFLEGLRGKLMARVGITFDHRLAPTLFSATLKLPLHFGPHARNHDPLQDLAIIRNFLMGAGPVALLDLPWIPLYFAILSSCTRSCFLRPPAALCSSWSSAWSTSSSPKARSRTATQAHWQR